MLLSVAVYSYMAESVKYMTYGAKKDCLRLLWAGTECVRTRLKTASRLMDTMSNDEQLKRPIHSSHSLQFFFGFCYNCPMILIAVLLFSVHSPPLALSFSDRICNHGLK